MVPKHQKTTTIEQRVRDLCSGLNRYVAKFDKEHIFTAPSLCLHPRTIERLRRHQLPCAAILDDEFLESLYATLASWGMHRIGSKGAKLRDYQSSKAGFAQHQGGIRS